MKIKFNSGLTLNFKTSHYVVNSIQFHLSACPLIPEEPDESRLSDEQ